MNEEVTNVDRMRFTKNTTSSRMALLAIVFDALFFISIYKSDVKDYYYTALIGASIIYNLLFMLSAFLCSEGVKNYKVGYSRFMIVLGILQVVRIFIFPVMMHGLVIGDPTESTIAILNMHFNVSVKNTVMGDWQFIRTCFYLLASAICLFAGARVNLKKSHALEAHMANLAIQ